MSAKSIYEYLKQGGLSHAGSCSMMGNMYCESLLKSDNVENRCTMSDEEYTDAVNKGLISCYQFSRDAFGYGLCQWTFWSRKEELWKRTVEQCISVADEMAQCLFCVAELKRDYRQLYDYLCSDCDLYTATARICKEYERPAYNNIDDRFAKAKEYDKEFSGDTPVPPPTPSTDSVDITVRVLRKGDLGRDVFMMQTGLQDMGIDCGIPDGDFGSLTERGVNDLREAIGLDADGTVDADVWQILFQ